MIAALLLKSSIREGTSFCRAVLISRITHPNQPSAPSQIPFPPGDQPLKLLGVSTGPFLPISQRQNAAILFPSKPTPQTQVP